MMRACLGALWSCMHTVAPYEAACMLWRTMMRAPWCVMPWCTKMRACRGALWSCVHAIMHHHACMPWRIMMLRACRVCALTMMHAACMPCLCTNYDACMPWCTKKQMILLYIYIYIIYSSVSDCTDDRGWRQYYNKQWLGLRTHITHHLWQRFKLHRR
jgi:hypothetical protein